MRVLCLLFVCAFLIATVSASQDDNLKAIIDWVRSKENGYFNEKLEIRRFDPTDPNSYYGVFATAKIRANELLLRLPHECRIQVEDTGDYFGDICTLAEALKKEMELGDGSTFAPYVNYLNQQRPGQIPSTWSDQGKKLFREIIGWKSDGTSDLPPDNPVGLMGTACDPALEHHVALVIQRGWDSVLCPIYDMVNHHNGKVNTENTLVKADEDFIMLASKDVEAGQEIHNTYDKCIDCMGVDQVWGTPEILRDFGFIEEYQRWHFGAGILDQTVSFNLDRTVVNGEPRLQVDWIEDKKPDHTGMKFLQEQHQRVGDLLENVIEPARGSVPDHEWNNIIRFHEAVLTALSSAMMDTCGTECSDQFEIEDIEKDIDGLYKPIYQCETLTHGIDHYNKIEQVFSQYQLIDYYQDPATNDTCFHLDDIFQMCACYWPHYHEMVVHKTAKYLKEDIKRVLWVGGGDSGLLNEIIKFPTLELVVGLELDQKVTRGAFKHFGSEPHYDNEKVQWWYGDASKSLLMLPKDYFGSFDMVLVDLSDTVFALSVSKELDVIGALSLLLRPGGIFEMNELCFESVSNAFEYTIHYSFQDVPKTCDQSLIIASNDIDFLDRELTEHKIENLLVEQSSHKTKHQFDMVHDYRKSENSSFRKLCERASEAAQEPLEQEASPGILMVLETENVSGQLDSIENVKNVAVEALQKEGLELVYSFSSSEADGMVAIVLREGYVVVRTWPDLKYCAFDIHFWSSFDKHEAAKKALIKSVGGDMGSTSSYRIVAGGMFGVSTWKEDVKSHGPQVPHVCRQSEERKIDKGTASNVVTVSLEEGLGMLQRENLVVAVLCGYDTEPCESVEPLKSNKNVLEVVKLHACPDIKPEESTFEGFRDKMNACGSEVLKNLQGSLKSLAGGKRLQAIVVDKNAPGEMGEVVEKIFRIRGNAFQLLAPEILVMATIEDRTEAWRRSFVSTFRKDVIKLDPVSSAQVLFKERNLEVDITASGDTNFIQHLTEMVSGIDKKTGLAAEIRNIVGGLWRSDPKFIMDDSEASQYFLPADLRHPSIARWRDQEPLGQQTVLQFEQGVIFEAGEKVLGDYQGLGVWFPAKIRGVHDDNTYHVVYDDGDEDVGVAPQMIRKLTSEALVHNTSKPPLTSAAIEDALKYSLSSMESEDMSNAETNEFRNVGDGTVLVAVWSGGIAVVLWDGRSHVDINLFTYTESLEIVNEFSDHFTSSIPGLTIVLRDEQPRGTGRVVNFEEDIEGTPHPYWAYA